VLISAAPVIEMTQRDARHFIFTQVDPIFGKTIKVNEFTVPTQIYRGIHIEGKDYEPGDTTTWAGSQWHCNKPTTEKPGISDAWTLAVKRGHNGKDGAAPPSGVKPMVKVG
jgi:hypothetical protein